MAGSRPLTTREERLLLRYIRRINARDRALISAQLYLGFRISEILALTIGHIVHHGAIRERVALPPRLGNGLDASQPAAPEVAGEAGTFRGKGGGGDGKGEAGA